MTRWERIGQRSKMMKRTSFTEECGLLSKKLTTSPNIILEASCVGNCKFPVPIIGKAMEVTLSSSDLWSDF